MSRVPLRPLVTSRVAILVAPEGFGGPENPGLLSFEDALSSKETTLALFLECVLKGNQATEMRLGEKNNSHHAVVEWMPTFNFVVHYTLTTRKRVRWLFASMKIVFCLLPGKSQLSTTNWPNPSESSSEWREITLYCCQGMM